MADKKVPIQSTAGAVPVRNEKGEVYMQKVRVSRYVTGKRPDYAPQDSSGEEDEDFIQKRLHKQDEQESEAVPEQAAASVSAYDRRLARLQQSQAEEDDQEDRYTRHQRRIDEPEVIGLDSGDEYGHRGGSDSEEDEEDIAEEEIERRRAELRLKARAQRQAEEEAELLEKTEAETAPAAEESSEEESEYEEYTDSEEEDGPMLKPVFVRKKDRITIQEKQRQVLKERELELEAKKLVEERKKQARKLVELAAKQEQEAKEITKTDIEAVNTDDDNDEEEYEAWKIRELRRIKRDRDDREAIEREKAEAERFRNMTEEERKLELKLNPKKVTNAVNKGKYKFMQKYYHRGAFYMNQDDDLLKRDFTAPTLEDHFDKTILPQVMQVKNFGRSGRTKYTHLVDQDTTAFDSAWTAETAQNLKFHSNKGGGLKQTFEKPVTKKK